MRQLITLLLIAIVAGLITACSCNNRGAVTVERTGFGKGKYWDELPEVQGGSELLKGKWSVTLVENGEFAVDFPLNARIKDLTFFDGRCAVTVEENDLGRPPAQGELSMKEDSTATPKTLDLIGPGSDQPWLLIYKVTRGGQLLLAMGRLTDPRPTGFDPTRHAITLLVCERSK